MRRKKTRRQSVLLDYPTQFDEIAKKIGASRAAELCRKDRNTVMETLRVDYRWSLSEIGELFGISRERVRQLTSAGILSGTRRGKFREPSSKEIDSLMRKAVRTTEAWSKKSGSLLHSWLAKQFGPGAVTRKSITAIRKDPRRRFKFEAIMFYGLYLNSNEEIVSWLHERQHGENYMTYEEIATYLSRRFVYITTMAVFRGAERCGHKGHSPGAPGQPRQYRSELTDKHGSRRDTL